MTEGNHFVGDVGDKEEQAGFIMGENICVDGGQIKLMIYHGNHGWTYS